MDKLTIKDIAELSNVSITTVSRVLNGNYPVNIKTKARVEEVIKKNGFQVNRLACSLKSKRSGLFALAIPGIIHSSFMQIAKGAQTVIEAHDDTLIVVDTLDNEQAENKVLQKLINWQVEGIIVASSSTNPKVINECIKNGIKIVLIDRDVEGVNNVNKVLWENTQTTTALMEYLISKGHKKIAAICAPILFNVGKERLSGYKKSLETHSLEVPEEFYSNRNANLEEAYETTKRLLTMKDKPTVLFCFSYFCTKGALKAIDELKLQVPNDISVVSFGDVDINEYANPKITTLEQDLVQMGKIAGEMLYEDSEPMTISLHSEIIRRNSVKDLNQVL